MANTTVTKVSELLLTNVTAGAKAGEQKVSEDSGFSKVMDSAKDSAAKVQPENTESNDQVRSSRTVVDNPKSKEIKAEEPVGKDPVGNEDDKAELAGTVAKEVTEITDKIKEVLNVTDEELTEAMETLGLTVIDLLDPVSIKDLCMELKGVEDSISLITNADLYENVKEIVQTAEDAALTLSAQFGITPDETDKIFTDESFVDAVKENLSDQKNNSVAPELQPNEAVIPRDGMYTDQMPISDKEVEIKDADASQLNTDNNRTEGMEAKTVTVEVKGTPEVKDDATLRQAPAEEAVADDPLARTTAGTTETFKAAAKPQESQLKGGEQENSNASRFVEVNTEAVNAAPQQTTVVTTEVNNLGQVVETVTTYSNDQANSIMSQVTDSIRVNYTPDTTSMELQLHPASLGTVNMNIASNNGVVTAHILVENEAVKAALESQLITLQQTFDEQGMKVEAVEVAVANYDLNRGNDSNPGEDAQKQSTSAGRITRRRSINLNDLDEEEIGELSEEEAISADMMARSGNSVDYTA